MTDALNDHVVTVSIGGRSITNLRFVDDIDGLAGREEECQNNESCMRENERNKSSDGYGCRVYCDTINVVEQLSQRSIP